LSLTRRSTCERGERRNEQDQRHGRCGEATDSHGILLRARETVGGTQSNTGQASPSPRGVPAQSGAPSSRHAGSVEAGCNPT
jgi:hypothetical protein